jgi:CheY-like chemotaxis protein
MVARVLESEGYAVTLAKTGREAIAKFMHNPPDLILLDLNMPELDGWKAFESVACRYPFVPVVIITAQPNQYEKAVGMGIDVLMEKPLDLPLLLKTMDKLLAESEKERVNRLTDRNFTTKYLGSTHKTEPEVELCQTPTSKH